MNQRPHNVFDVQDLVNVQPGVLSLILSTFNKYLLSFSGT